MCQGSVRNELIRAFCVKVGPETTEHIVTYQSGALSVSVYDTLLSKIKDKYMTLVNVDTFEINKDTWAH